MERWRRSYECGPDGTGKTKGFAGGARADAGAVRKETGISKSALGNYETEDYKDISHTSIVTLAKFYGVSTDYLLGLTETENHPNAELDELRLSDEMIELLESAEINTRLLCEIAAHRDFGKLLAD